MFWVKTIVDVSAEAVRTMKPRASAEKNATREPFRSVVAVGRALIRYCVVVAVWTLGRNSDLNSNLGIRVWSGCDQSTSYKSCQRNKLKSCL